MNRQVNMNPLRICFSSPMARPVFEPHCTGPFGGSEVRAFVLATGLVRKGMDVTVVVDAHAAPVDRHVEGVRLSYRPLPAELPRLRDETDVICRLRRTPLVMLRRLGRSIEKRWRRLQGDRPRFDPLLARTGADVYCAFGVHEHAASVVHTAAWLGRPSVLFLASDTDLDESYRPNGRERNVYGQRVDLCYHALRHATRIIAQTARQQQLLYERFDRDATIVRNPLPPLQEPTAQPGGADAVDVLWIGRADRFSKRADLAIELARRCPQLRFCLIMNRRDPRVHQQLIGRLPANVCLVDQVPWREVHRFFLSSAMLLNTSAAEGFPNTFLQAAQHGRPIVSLNVDPEGMLSRHAAGVVTGGDLEETVRTLRTLAADGQRREQLGAAGRRYVLRYHTADGCCAVLAQLLSRLLAASGVRSCEAIESSLHEGAAA